MEELNNIISPFVSKLLNMQMWDRLIGKDEPETRDLSSSQLPCRAEPVRLGQINHPIIQNRLTTEPISGGSGKTMRHLQTRQLGQLDPRLYLSEEGEELYDLVPGHIGRLWFTLSYSKSDELLKVILHKARNLRRYSSTPTNEESLPHNEENSPQDFRIKIFLELSERKFHVTSIKRQTANPDFNEHFCFQVPAHTLDQQILRLNAIGIDRKRRNKLIGYALIKLNVLQHLSPNQQDIRLFRDLQLDRDNEASENPQLFVALTYFPSAERLIVGLFQCRNLPLRENGTTVDVYAKVVVYQGLQGKELRVKRTESMGSRKSFDESFAFHKISDPNDINVRIALIQNGFIDKPLCFVVLGGALVSKGSGIVHWKAMMENSEQQVCEWHELQFF